MKTKTLRHRATGLSVRIVPSPDYYKAGLWTAKEFMDRHEPGTYERTLSELRALGKYAASLKKKDHP